jgi:hypothetical protein
MYKESIGSIFIIGIIILFVSFILGYTLGTSHQEERTSKFLCEPDKVISTFREEKHTYVICDDGNITFKKQID